MIERINLSTTHNTKAHEKTYLARVLSDGRVYLGSFKSTATRHIVFLNTQVVCRKVPGYAGNFQM